MKIKWPEIQKAHTYASENADVYHAFDDGQKYMLRLCQEAFANAQPKANEELDEEDIKALNLLENILETMFWKGEKDHPEKIGMIKAFKKIHQAFKDGRMGKDKG